MTPTETFAQKRAEAVELIRAHAPARLQDSLIELLRPAIALTATRANDEEIPVGASKFGGAPDVPEGFEWPSWNDKPLGFLAQINLEEVAAFDVENLLPRSGNFAFFHRWNGFFHKDVGQLVWFNDENLNRFPDPPRQKQGEHNFIPSCHIQARPQWTLPESQLVDESLEMDDEECEIYIEDLQIVLAEETGDLPAHRMLGYPISIQDGVQLGAEFERQGGRWHENRQNIEREAHNWRLLFQMDSQQPDWIWGDLGKAYFLIRDEDLAARRFDQTFFEFQCH